MEVLRRSLDRSGLKAYPRCAILRQVRYYAMRPVGLRFDLISAENRAPPLAPFPGAATGDVASYRRDLCRIGSAECCECGGGGGSLIRLPATAYSTIVETFLVCAGTRA